MSPYIIASANWGLANRLKCLISAMRLAERYSRTLLLYWPKDGFVNCRFADLFENEFMEIGREELDKIKEYKDSDKVYQIVSTWRLLTLPQDDIPNNFSRVYPSLTGKDIDCEYERIPFTVREQFLPYVRQLTPRREILEEVEEHSKNFNDDTVSVSIRSWIECPPRQCLFDINNLYSVLDKINCSDFFVSCDSEEILEKIVGRYGRRVMFHRKYTYKKGDTERDSMRAGLCDLLLLSRNRRLFLSYLSTFSEMAWWFGGCKAKTELIPPRYYLFKRVVILEPDMMALCMLWSRYFPIQERHVRLMRRVTQCFRKPIRVVSRFLGKREKYSLGMEPGNERSVSRSLR